MDKQVFLEKIGRRIRKLRKEKGISMLKLAKAMDKEYHSLLKLEQGKANLSYLYLCDVAEGLGVDVSEIVKGL